MRTLRERLEDWVEVETAAFEVAVLLGLVRRDADLFRGADRFVWADSDVGDTLLAIVGTLIDGGILEADDPEETTMVRFDPAFEAWWEEPRPED